MAIKRYSKQRELIYEALKNTDKHPTAEMVYNWLKPEIPALSLGTVYRNLNQLADEGNIIRLAFPVERYDANIRPHAHMLCQNCGNVYDLLSLDYDASLDELAETGSGHRILRHELLFTGICTQCTEKH
jgi:Fe2+/Zn2+ uptake regulation proteins